MKHYVIFLAISLISFMGLAQVSADSPASQGKVFGISVGYFGDKIQNHGYFIALESQIVLSKNFGVIRSVQVTNYFADQNFTGVSVLPRVGLRYSTNVGLFSEGYLGFGFLQKFYKFDEFLVNDKGEVVSRGRASQASTMPSIALGLGYDLKKITQSPLVCFVRGSINYNYPNKHFLFEASYAIEAGITYMLVKEKDRF